MKYIIGVIKLIIFILYAACIIVISPFMWGFMWLCWRKKPEVQDRFVQKFIKSVFRFVNGLVGVTIVAKGVENIPTDESVVYIGNHKSYFDILVSYLYFPNPTGFLAKQEMKRIPVIYRWMRYVKCLFINRADVKEGLKTILEAIDQVKNGTSLMIFPEGTRVRTEEMLPFHEGSFKVATKSGHKIVPVTLMNTAEVFEAHMPTFRKTKVLVEFGKPIVVSELEPEQKKFLGAYVQGIIKDTMAKNQEEAKALLMEK
ncbi:MAG: 1-acyl-sn-glycerol-3-phosphate acyltransferase [Lachnospiraceae bacterium]|nr:1-acyl-sn-glycerol-3-phosphate acyltransferase [Lachnospiraceae bacterium]